MKHLAAVECMPARGFMHSLQCIISLCTHGMEPASPPIDTSRRTFAVFPHVVVQSMPELELYVHLATYMSYRGKCRMKRSTVVVVLVFLVLLYMCSVLYKDKTTGVNVSLSQSEVDGVEKLVLFIGYPRSGHSIIGSMMDAHPNIVIAHEYRVLEECALLNRPSLLQDKGVLFSKLYNNSYNNAIQMSGWRSERDIGKGYNLRIPTSWQGTFRQLKIIGDKSGGYLSATFSRRFNESKACFEMLRDVVGVPIVMFHVVRNPFDMIATGALHRFAHEDDMRAMRQSGNQVLLEPQKLRYYIKMIFWFAETVLKVSEFAHVIDIHSEDFIRHPQEVIKHICTVLEVPCPADYVTACHEKVFRNISRSRDNVVWERDVVQYVEWRMKRFPFFSQYSFDNS